MIHASAISGEKDTGYEDEENLGEFECENCKHYREHTKTTGGCAGPSMMKLSKRPKYPDGTVKVEAEGCCIYVIRVGRPDKVEARSEVIRNRYFGKKT